MSKESKTFTDLLLSQWQHGPSSPADRSVPVSGVDLTIADVIAVSRHLAQVDLTPGCIDAIEACSKIIPDKIAQGDVIYGVNTGFGGSADTRSNDVEWVQQSLISHLSCGIVADGRQDVAKEADERLVTSNGNGHISNGQENNGQVTNGHASNGHANNIHNGNGHASNGFSGNGHTSNNNASNDLSSNGIEHTSNGHIGVDQTNNVENSNGHTSNGSSSNGLINVDQPNNIENGNVHESNGFSSNDNEQITNGLKSNGNEHTSNGFSSNDHANNDLKSNGKVKIHKPVARRAALPLNDPLAATCMPESWARASMLIRLNSLAGGASGIQVGLAESLKGLLNKDVVPRIPVRGSISASGDLSALAWIGALMQGKTFATAYCGPRDVAGARKVTRADAALAEVGMSPITLQAKEGLAIVNGTAVSAAVATLAAHESIHLAALSQVLTAMSVEALRGSDESFEPFIARIRPHPGQIDSAKNIKAFLAGSSLLNRHDSKNEATLRQDRYSLRTASQWIGPVLEDFGLAYDQLTIELNSVTDNPLIDTSTSRVLHGGNFQARAVTSAAEKLRQGLQSIGRMLFVQCTEMINPATSWGLPPNLCSDDPNDSFLFKGLDVVTAGLTSELGFLANPVGSHVQTAEMGNQSLNSMALVSARYTLEAADVLSQLASAHILALCQALDLRTIEIEGRSADSQPDATKYIGQASRKMYNFVRRDLGIPFLGEQHLASAESVTPDGVTPSIGLYNTRVYESIRSGKLYDLVLEIFQDAQPQQTTNGH